MDARGMKETESRRNPHRRGEDRMRATIRGGHLTLEMESLLVHSDGECAVVLIIDANHSSLGGQGERGTEGREWKSQSVSGTHHPPPFSPSIPAWVTFVHDS